MGERNHDRLLRQQSALADFGNFARHEANLDVVFAEATRVCATGLESRYCKIFRFRPEENDLLLEAGHGWQPGVVGHYRVPADDNSPQGLAFLTGKPSIYNDLRSVSDLDLPRLYSDHDVASIIYVTIRGNGTPFGILGVLDDKSHVFNESDIDFLTGFANVLAAAIALAVRTAELQTALAHAEVQVAESEARATEKALLASELQRSLEEREILAEELQHRVRNSLQLIHAMLNKDVSPDEARGALRAAARRVSTLAQVYDHLLGSGMTRTTNFAAFASALCDGLRTINAKDGGRVSFEYMIDPLLLDLDVVTPLGLIITEVVTNSFEHAFPGGSGSIQLTCTSGNGIGRLTIADDGLGYDTSTTSGRNGIRLIGRLIEQIYGRFEVVSGVAGTTWTIRFPTTTPVEA